MSKEKNTAHAHEFQASSMKVVDVSQDQAHLEFEIDRHVKSIRVLIQKLRPVERRKYFDGLLSHILSQPVEYPATKASTNNSFDYCNLSVNELSLIRELSLKIHDLYRVSEWELNS